MTSRLALSIALFALTFQKAMGAACCGGLASVPSLISGDDRMQFSTTLSSSNVVAEAPVGGGISYRGATDDELAQMLRIDAATLLMTERFQAGITIPVIRRSRIRGARADSTGFGDFAFSLGYEFLPDWSYSVWRPKGIVFLVATFPTGGSIYDSTALYGIDSRGKGFFSFSLGTLFVKSWRDWDASFLVEGHRSLSRTITSESGTLILKPGWGASGNFSLGLSPWSGPVRVGLGLSQSIEDSVSTEGTLSGIGERQITCAVTGQLSYLASDSVSISLSYIDQTIIRQSENSALSKTFAFLIQKRFER